VRYRGLAHANAQGRACASALINMHIFREKERERKVRTREGTRGPRESKRRPSPVVVLPENPADHGAAGRLESRYRRVRRIRELRPHEHVAWAQAALEQRAEGLRAASSQGEVFVLSTRVNVGPNGACSFHGQSHSTPHKTSPSNAPPHPHGSTRKRPRPRPLPPTTRLGR